MSKKYYSPIKEYSKVKKRHPFYKLFRAIIKLFFPKNEVIWQTDKPSDNEPIFYVCNHTRLYAPVFFLLSKKPVRVWSNYYFLFYKECWQHLKNKVFQNHKYLLPLGFILTPLIVLLFRAFEPIPVYHKSSKVITHTFEKSIETLQSGMDQAIFPERTENRVNKYIFQFNHGFPLMAQIYYEKTGKKLKFYPVYCAQKLRKVVIGNPIEYNPNIPMKIQRTQICEYLEKQIEILGDSLPEHKPVLYNF
ncbi:MAG: hypothetical protein GX242_03880 [Clostridiales bacterium]|nr:hypothetical protein [Clostridiales bacterium]